MSARDLASRNVWGSLVGGTVCLLLLGMQVAPPPGLEKSPPGPDTGLTPSGYAWAPSGYACAPSGTFSCPSTPSGSCSANGCSYTNSGCPGSPPVTTMQCVQSEGSTATHCWPVRTQCGATYTETFVPCNLLCSPDIWGVSWSAPCPGQWQSGCSLFSQEN